MGKGISPLIAAVLLIAFTMAVAGLAGPFLTEITQKAQGDTVNKSQTIVDSTNARIEIMSTSYNSSNSSYSVTIRNSGTDSIQDFTATIYGDSPKQKKINKKLEAGEVHTFNIEQADNSTKIEIEARDLPVKTDAELSEEDGSSSSSTASVKTYTISSYSDWESGSFNGSTAYKPDNQDSLSIGYRNGSSNDNLSAYWRFDQDVSGSGGTFKDYSGNSNDGTTENSINTGVQGVFGTDAIKLDDTTDQVSVPDSSAVKAQVPWTIVSWQKLSALPSNKGTMRVLDKQSSNSRTGWLYRWETDDNFYIYHGDGSSWNKLSSTTTATKDKWFFIVYTVDSSGQELYVGTEDQKPEVEGSSTNSISSSTDTTDMMVGDDARGINNDNFLGKIDEVRFYNKSLDNSEVQELYHYGSPFHGEYNSTEINPSGSSHDWQDLEVDTSGIDSETDLSVNFSALDSSGNVKDFKFKQSLSSGTQNISLTSVQDTEKAKISFNGTTNNITKTWNVSQSIIYYK